MANPQIFWTNLINLFRFSHQFGSFQSTPPGAQNEQRLPPDLEKKKSSGSAEDRVDRGWPTDQRTSGFPGEVIIIQ